MVMEVINDTSLQFAGIQPQEVLVKKILGLSLVD